MADAPGPDPSGRARAMHAVEQTARRLQSPLVGETLAGEIIAILESLLGYEFAAVLLLDDAGRLTPFAISEQGRGPEFVTADRAYLVSQGIGIDKGITGWVVSTGRAIRLGDVRQDPRYAAVRPDVSSELCVPLIADGQPIGVINIESVQADRYTDIDEQVLSIVAAQIAVAIHNTWLHDRMRADEARVRHAERVEAAARLAAGAAHDVRGVLTSVRGYTELAGATIPSGHPAQHDLAAIRATCDRGTALTDQLMDIGRSSSLRPVAVDLHTTVQAIRPAVERAVGAAHRVEWWLAPGPIPARVDPRAVERILVNLVTNARDASPTGATIGVRVGGDDVRSWLEVVDHGVGMDAGALEHAFEAFYSTKGSAQGTGLGLAVVQGLAAASGGEVDIASVRGEGTTVRVTLPATSG